MRCMADSLIINIQTRMDISSWETGKTILSPAFSRKKLSPQQIATYGEVTSSNGTSVTGIDECEANWAVPASVRVRGSFYASIQDFHWKRLASVKSKGAVTFPYTNSTGSTVSGGLFFQSQYDENIDWGTLFKQWCEATSPFGAILHPSRTKKADSRRRPDVRSYTLAQEIENGARARFESGILFCEFRAGELNTRVTGLTNLGWATWFGGEHKAKVDAKAISAAGFPIHEVGNAYLVQVTEKIGDVLRDYPMFSERRSKLKSLFGTGLFLVKEESDTA